MSDGNFNRNLLPYHNYTSGVRAGRTQTVQRAMQVLRELMEKRLPSLSREETENLLRDFHEKLTGKP